MDELAALQVENDRLRAEVEHLQWEIAELRRRLKDDQ